MKNLFCLKLSLVALLTYNTCAHSQLLDQNEKNTSTFVAQSQSDIKQAPQEEQYGISSENVSSVGLYSFIGLYLANLTVVTALTYITRSGGQPLFPANASYFETSLQAIVGLWANGLLTAAMLDPTNPALRPQRHY